MKSFDIVGYMYTADTFCVDCTRDLAVQKALEAGSATSWGDAGTAEQVLGEWASLIGINRMDGGSYDSGDFPKVIFADQVESTEELCGRCGESLIPNN